MPLTAKHLKLRKGLNAMLESAETFENPRSNCCVSPKKFLLHGFKHKNIQLRYLTKPKVSKQTNHRNMTGSFHTARLPVCRVPSVTLRARELWTELLVKVAKWFHLLWGSSSIQRLRAATVHQVLSLSDGWSFTRGWEARYGKEKPGVIWISNHNADSTSFSERFYPTFQILKISRR